MYKSLYDISWKVDEPTYRADPALSYSTLAKYERGGGFESLLHLFDRVESPSLLKGSCLDTYLTDGEDAYFAAYYIDDIPDLDPKVANTVKFLFDSYSDTCDSIDKISDNAIVAAVKSFGIFNNCSRTPTIVSKMVESGSAYYRALYLAEGKTIISNELHRWVLDAAEALKNSPATGYFFAPHNPFNEEDSEGNWIVERLYQAKFKATLDRVDYRCMFDVLLCLHDKKIIIPVDLKTSSKKEFNFHKSFVEWLYPLQAKLYTAILKDNLSRDEYFKDFKILPYQFIVANNQGGIILPMCWQFNESINTDDFIYGSKGQYKIRGPLTIGKELRYYLDNECMVPQGIYLDKPNNLIEWLNKL